MIAVWALAALVCAAALIAGRALLLALGRREWTWLEAPVGLAALVVVAQPLVRLPGHGATAAIALGALLVAALAFVVRRAPAPATPAREALPPALVVLAAASIPFALNARVGVLGEGIYTNDHAAQLFWTEWLATGFGPEPRGIEFGYPLGPQSLVAALARGTGSSVETAFNGLLLAIPVLTALAALAVLRELPPARRTIAAALVGLPYLAASFLAQSAFKETAMALFVVGVAVALSELGRRSLAPTAVALGVLALAAVLTFSLAGLVWPLAAAAIWLGLELAAGRVRVAPREALAALRPAWPALAAAAAVVAVVAVAQAGTLSGFIERFGDIQATTGRLFSSVSPREALGLWPEGDFRVDASGDAAALLATLVGLVATAVAAWWWWSRRDLAVPATLAAAILVYLGARAFGGIHVQAKALAVMAPVAMLFVLRAVLAPRDSTGRATVALASLAVVFVLAAAGSTFLALRAAPVGTNERAEELEELADEVQGQRVLVLVADRFAPYRLQGTLTASPGGYVPSDELAGRPGKRWDQRRALEFDSVSHRVLNSYQYVITSNAAFASSPPPGYERDAQTPSFTLWRRDGRVPAARTIEPPTEPGAVLDCDRPEGRALSRTRGVATILPEPIVGGPDAWRPESSFVTGGFATQTFELGQGEWAVSLQYHSPEPLEVEVEGGVDLELPASLDGMFGFAPGEGQFWDAGTIEVDRARRVRLTIRQQELTWVQRLLGVERRTWLGTVALTPVVDRPQDAEVGFSRPYGEVVPLRDACGRYVDRYSPDR